MTTKKAADKPDSMREEYRFDDSRSKPNRFAGKMSRGTVAVVLDPDVARVFPDAAAVNEALRLLARTATKVKAGTRGRAGAGAA